MNTELDRTIGNKKKGSQETKEKLVIKIKLALLYNLFAVDKDVFNIF